MTSNYDLLIVGGGAAGLMSATIVQNKGLRVGLLERNARIGKKLLATGNGRCNYTNIYTSLEDFSGEDVSFASTALETFPPQTILSYFRSLGIEPQIEANGKAFPSSEQASSFLDLFLLRLRNGDIDILTDTFVKGIRKKKGRFIVTTNDGRNLTAKKVLLCTGGKAMPSSGSDGNGYSLAASLGHSITPLSPSLVQLMLQGNFFPKIEGVKLRRWLHLGLGDEFLQTEEGDLLFANYGISGPPALQLSRLAGALLAQGKTPWVSISLFNEPLQETYERLMERSSFFPDRSIHDALIGLVHKRLIPVIIQEAGIDNIRRTVSSLTKKETYSLARLLTDWRIPIRGLKGWSSAQVTAGGVNTKEVDPASMESTIISGLYFAGEILDIDGRSGGFNLQWAWSSAAIASRAIISDCQS
ncbi:MAG: NAD(P)/FAD-dependent oxidoreductase [Tissierellia bacterium]|nr:NAD(P)/FAD-dependent oxidoreductase [Bacillota bacterium]NLL22799.1 NAD(P)/FAD-dependent oxidoreductase [Tissierellia bacterium]